MTYFFPVCLPTIREWCNQLAADYTFTNNDGTYKNGEKMPSKISWNYILAFLNIKHYSQAVLVCFCKYVAS